MKTKTMIEETIEDHLYKIEEKFVMVDKRIGRVKSEFDVGALHKLIDAKANNDIVSGELQGHETKLATLDRNQLAMAEDFATFQKAINSMHATLMDLQERSSDVLVGKRNINCLSCSTKDNLTGGNTSS